MAMKIYDEQNVIAIANAIRSKNGETTQYKPSEMAAAISAIETALEVLPQDTVSGAIANFPDGSNNYPVVELIADINPKQSGSGDPSPSNIRPISGSSSVVISVADENNIVQSTKTIDLGRTVYGGSLNVTSGLLVKDRAYHKITSADTMYLYNSANGFLVNTSSFAEGEMIALSNSGGLCNAFATVTASTNMGVRFGMSNNSMIYFVQVYDLMGSTLQDIKDYIDEHDIYVAYRLATPETYQLSPEEVKTLLGVNNIYADTGDVEVTYRADIDLYIAKKIGE